MEDSDDNELPNIVLDSPYKTVKKHDARESYTMPNARKLAAERKTEIEQDIIVSQIISKIKDISFEIPNPEMLVIERKNDLHHENIIENLLKNLKEISLSDLEKDLTSSLLELDLNIKVLSECPGIEMNSINLDNLKGDLAPFRIKFLKEIFNTLIRSTEEEFENKLNVLLTELRDGLVILEFEDILCYTFLICVTLLDKKCRNIITSVNRCEILWQILENVTAELQSFELVCLFCSKILSQFQHFHDRFYLAECFERIKCKPLDVGRVPEYFSNRLAKCILHYTLYDLVGHEKEIYSENNNTFSNLKRIVNNGANIYSLEPYRRYILIKILNMLNSMIVQSDNEEEIKAKKWFITYFNTLKYNQTQRGSFSADLFKVKVLCAYTNLLWREQCEDIDKECNIADR